MGGPEDSGQRSGPERDLPEILDSKAIYKGKIVSLRVDEILLPNIGRATREVVDHPGAVVIIALDEEERVYLVSQYRHAIRRMLLEFPAGTLEPGEEPLAAAKRELREEVGLTATKWTPLGSFFSSPGFLNERLHVFLAQDLTLTEAEPDYDEDLSVVCLDMQELRGHLEMIPDAKTLAALHLLQDSRADGT